METDHHTSPDFPLKDWDRPIKPREPLPGQIEMFVYQPYLAPNGQAELFDTGRDLPGAEEENQRLIWDVEK
jgi:hypothetical protein